MKQLFTFLLLFSITYTNAQSFEWAKSFGSQSVDYGYSTVTDINNNVYTTGFFRDTTDFDPGAGVDIHIPVTPGADDIYVQKLDANGNYIWTKTFGGTSNDKGLGITIDANGDICVVGHFINTVDFDPGIGVDMHTSTSLGQQDVFVLKLDANGNHLWAKTFGGTQNEYGFSIATDANNNVYTTGIFRGTVDFDPDSLATNNLDAVGLNDAFVHKLDASGNFVWAKTFGSTDHDLCQSITIDASGNPCVTGYFKDTVDFDPGLGVDRHIPHNLGYNDVFVQKLDPNGNFVWAKSFGGSADAFDVFRLSEYGQKIAIDSENNIYLAGEFEDTVDFDPGANTQNMISYSSSYEDAYVLKIDSNGNYLWAHQFGGVVGAHCGGIDTDVNDFVYVAGSYGGTVDFDPTANIDNQSSNGSADIFVLKLDKNGNYLWSESFGATSFDLATGLAVDNSGKVLITGTYSNTITFNTSSGSITITAQGFNDAYVIKMQDMPLSNPSIETKDQLNAISIYPNPTTGQLTLDVGKNYQDLSIAVYSTTGQLIQHQNTNNQKLVNLSLEGNTGIYFVKIQTSQQLIGQFKILKH
ncbi:MAG: T9SS type A sorting domain-containing protein [Saprospiraceae bacterium]|nr:T9SS type A sorting domain-containing protein [Saprospiraceae bacterium]